MRSAFGRGVTPPFPQGSSKGNCHFAPIGDIDADFPTRGKLIVSDATGIGLLNCKKLLGADHTLGRGGGVLMRLQAPSGYSAQALSASTGLETFNDLLFFRSAALPVGKGEMEEFLSFGQLNSRLKAVNGTPLTLTVTNVRGEVLRPLIADNRSFMQFTDPESHGFDWDGSSLSDGPGQK